MRIHSVLSDKCEYRENLGYKGIFAKNPISKGEMIALWGGIVYSKQETEKIGKLHPHFLTHPVSIYDGYYLGPVGTGEMDDAEFFNHACEPNAGVKGQIILIARKDISKDEEITFDYETTEINGQSFECECGSENCRKIIDGNAWKDCAFQKNNTGYLSWYIEEKIRNLNS